jgi:predicted nucleic acid-binding protein
VNVVVDTNILCEAVEHSVKHLTVLTNLHQFRHSLVLDHQGQLFREYQDQVGQCDFFQKWFKELQTSQLVYWCNGCISKYVARELCHRQLHEPEDHVVVALAMNSGKYIVTEDSDFGKGDSNRSIDHQDALLYLTNDLGLTVHDADEACEHLRNAS